MRVLFIGGSGVISSACSAEAVERGIDLYLLNRGQSSRPTPKGAHVLRGDIRDPASAREALGDLTFDAVVNWVAFTPEHVETDLELFKDRTATVHLHLLGLRLPDAARQPAHCRIHPPC